LPAAGELRGKRATYPDAANRPPTNRSPRLHRRRAGLASGRFSFSNRSPPIPAMKKSAVVSLLAAALFTASAAFAADKEVTLVGAGQCAKCSLGVTKACQTAVVVKQDGKEQVYLLTENDVSKKFHDEVCTDTKQIKVTGVVKDLDGKKEITASSIELVKG
jgi:hypothetical protein